MSYTIKEASPTCNQCRNVFNFPKFSMRMNDALTLHVVRATILHFNVFSLKINEIFFFLSKGLVDNIKAQHV